MNLSQLAQALTIYLQNTLPGSSAHESMRALPVGNVIPNFEHKLPAKKGSVLILLYEHNGQIKFPLIKRQEYLGAHSGQISLPGGKTEPGEDAYQAALREGEEEIGINRTDMKVVGQLSEFFVIPSNFIVTPIVAFLDKPPIFIPDPYEVAKIISGSIQELVSDDAILKKEILAAGSFRMMAPHFEIEGETVWGATAMMLNEFRLVLKDIFKSIQ
jgi:8-oxo-dGTP pyrophosphatase MutT (NUDIX family)